MGAAPVVVARKSGATIDMKPNGFLFWSRGTGVSSPRPERLWEAITDPQIRAKYHVGAGVHSDWTPGSGFTMVHPGAEQPLAEGENIIVEPPRRLVQSMRTLWSEAAEAAEEQGTTRVTWEIEPVGDSCRLTVTHDQLSGDAPPELYGGWPMILSGLKTWLETGESLTTPGSQMYGPS